MTRTPRAPRAKHPALLAALVTVATLLVLLFGRHLGGPLPHLPHATTSAAGQRTVAKHVSGSAPNVAAGNPSIGASGAPATAPTTSPPATTRPASTPPPTSRSASAPSATTGTPAAASSPRTRAPAGARAVGRHVTAIGDSVMLDYASNLETDLPGCTVDAKVGQQWDTGVALARSLAAEGRLGSVVVVALGANGPISGAQVNAMMQALSGAQRVVLVTDHVDRPWQDPNNAALLAAAKRFPAVAIADWNALASGHPDWFYADGTHLPIGGPGATALAQLVTSVVEG